jgi:hypothetical protein
MKMAKASPEDLDMALDLISVLDDIERGFFPHRFSDPDSEISEWLDFTNREQYGRLIDNLRRLLNRGSIGRVIMGMAVVCDPSNECIDPGRGCATQSLWDDRKAAAYVERLRVRGYAGEIVKVTA